MTSKTVVSKMFSEINMPSAKTLVSTAASLAASAMVVRSVARDLIPYELQQYVYLTIQNFFGSFSSEIVLIIEESNGLSSNQIYYSAEIYLGTKVSPCTNKFMVSMPKMETKISTTMARNQEILDIFNGVHFKWRQITRQVESKRAMGYPGQYVEQSELRYFVLRFHKKHKKMVFESYFPFILQESKNIKVEKKTLKIYTLNNDHMRRYSSDYSWNSVKLDHPATFNTVAMDPRLKMMIMDDLDRFVRRKDFYRKVGKAWKRGYLLYGPPGTGKSSLIAAMANYLKFDIYDLELTDIHANSDLRRLLVNTKNRSIIVVEDIDCSLEIQDRKAEDRALKILQSSQASQAQNVNILRQNKPNQVTLSGLLNFIDGLWSSCGDERIIVFTTNHKDRLNPALLRPGRMDLHVHMSYCKPCAFKTLAENYLGITDHFLIPQINNLLEGTNVTPAEVGEQLLRNEEVEISLGGLVEFLQEKKRENDEQKAKESLQEQEEEGQNVDIQID
ncbi:AAA-ATPase At3g50940-like [Olea europaea subsp. europaea]|uniref:AAA-ATPase At3g50940-like n=1 Tax=Olea europaea subsp. europaea TaxID=158383 RepID=A0A8S0RHU6_OLEEU|nr:AAA-ATPase At3g50940-like [Olea europaea subsp. europaea]